MSDVSTTAETAPGFNGEMASTEMPKAYEPRNYEAKWYPFWLSRNYFHAKDTPDAGKPFSVVIPPPNVTGALHMGHAFNTTLQDILVRFRRMQGYNVCWLPGTDHAGIATQNVVEKAMALEGVDRHQIGREKFVERVWDWKEQYGDRIVSQLQRLGASCDWERQRFTMDEGLSKAVQEVFYRLHQEGFIYRGEYLINWCPRCRTALSDLEVEHEDIPGHLWKIRYQQVDGGSPLVIATTRPETLFGDTAVAVHPDDERYAQVVGKTLRLPLTDREIPVISDHRVDPKFGSGVVKITPAHDHNDFAIGNDHQLPRINILTPAALLNEHAGKFANLAVEEARRQVVAALVEADLLVSEEEHEHSVGHCYRCKTIVEPYLSLQWFVSTKKLAKKAADAVKQGKTEIFPRQWQATYLDWMKRIQDWCISRQIWWGHRIPAWYCPNAVRRGEHERKDACPPVVDRGRPEVCPQCGSKDLVQDEDVLDTWFSSALWPFSAFGWPEQTAALKNFYPTSVLVTGFDIIFFWVARMMMMGIRFMGEVPFRQVYIHALVRDPLGKKMSKSKGNVIDPLELMDRYGTDALRFTLAAFAAQGRDIRISDKRVAGYRNFCNKLWNVTRFFLLRCTDEKVDPEMIYDKRSLSLADKWLLNRYQHAIKEVTSALDGYNFDAAASALYRFVWGELCDWYIEAIKPQLIDSKGNSPATRHTLWIVLEGVLKLLHPFMPFITEELWQRVRELSISASPDAAGIPKESIVVAPWPEADKRAPYANDAKQFAILADVVTAIRTIRSEHNLNPTAPLVVLIYTPEAKLQKLIGSHGSLIRSLSRSSRLELRIAPLHEPGLAIELVHDIEVGVQLTGLVDFAAERERLEKEITRVSKATSSTEAKLADKQFVERAPKQVVKAAREQLASLQHDLVRLRQSLQHLQ